MEHARQVPRSGMPDDRVNVFRALQSTGDVDVRATFVAVDRGENFETSRFSEERVELLSDGDTLLGKSAGLGATSLAAAQFGGVAQHSTELAPGLQLLEPLVGSPQLPLGLAQRACREMEPADLSGRAGDVAIVLVGMRQAQSLGEESAGLVEAAR